jgi:hypothetical protein
VSFLLLVLIYYLFFSLSTLTSGFTFCFLLSDKENTKRFVVAAPATNTPTIDEPSSHEADLAVKSPKAPRAPVKKVVTTRGSMRVKKSTNASASLEAHRSTSSSDDVRAAAGTFSSFFCLRDFHTHVFS